MSAITVDLTIVSNGKTYKFFIEDSFTFSNFSDIIAISADFSKLLSSNKKDVFVCKEDGFCSMNMSLNYDAMLNNFNEQFFKMVTTQIDIGELHPAGITQRTYINLDERIYNSKSFDEIGERALQELFHG